jgi:hypothetical protein
MSSVSHTSDVIFELVDKTIEELGEDEVVQVVIDNVSNNMGVNKLLYVKRPQIFWTSCDSHTINLMLQGIGAYQGSRRCLNRQRPSPSLSMGIQEP